MFEKIGRIENTFLGVEDHGIMTFILYFDFGGLRQGFGSLGLDNYDKEQGRNIGTAAGMDAVMQIIKACGVESWEKVKGKTMYALYDREGHGETIKGIKALSFEEGGTFLIEKWREQWFPPGV